MADKKTSGTGKLLSPEILAAAVLGACNIVAAQIAANQTILTKPGDLANAVGELVDPILDMARHSM